MTLEDPGHIAKVQDAIAKAADATDKVCVPFTDELVSDADKMLLQTGMAYLAQAQEHFSGTLPPSGP